MSCFEDFFALLFARILSFFLLFIYFLVDFFIERSEEGSEWGWLSVFHFSSPPTGVFHEANAKGVV
jgi:hypothetical protein